MSAPPQRFHLNIHNKRAQARARTRKNSARCGAGATLAAEPPPASATREGKRLHHASPGRFSSACFADIFPVETARKHGEKMRFSISLLVFSFFSSASVHAQSPRQIECCAELGRESPSNGEPAYPHTKISPSSLSTLGLLSMLSRRPSSSSMMSILGIVCVLFFKFS